jgi:hypothetical protein
MMRIVWAILFVLAAIQLVWMAAHHDWLLAAGSLLVVVTAGLRVFRL